MNFFRFTWLPYIQGYLDFKSIFDIERLYYNQFEVIFKKSKLQGALYLTINGDGDFCPGLGWNHDAVDLSLQMVSHFD